MSSHNAREIASITNAGKIAGVARRTIYNWLKDNKVEYIRTAGGSIRIYVDTLFRESEGQCERGSNLRELHKADTA